MMRGENPRPERTPQGLATRSGELRDYHRIVTGASQARASPRRADLHCSSNDRQSPDVTYDPAAFEAFKANRFSLAESVSPTEASATMVVVSLLRAALASTTSPRLLSSRQACSSALSIKDNVSGP